VVNEPKPPGGDHVPASVLDELRAAFSRTDVESDAEAETVGPEVEAEPDTATATLTDLPEPEPEREPEPEPDATVVAPAVTEPPPARATIVIGGSDELPDPVYLDEAGVTAPTTDAHTSASDHGPRNTIVLGDELEASGAFDAVELPSRSMDPRLRARRIAVKRAQGRKRLVWVGGIGGIVLVVVAVLGIFASSLFAVEVIDVQGAVYTSARNGDQLEAVLAEIRGKPVLLVDTLQARRDLEEIPWVEDAFVTTDFPNRVVIDVRERQPLATFQGSDARYRVIDRDGRVLDVLDGRPVDYILLTGVGPDLDPGSLAGTQFAEAAQMAGALPAEIRSITESASVDATTGDLGLRLAGGIEVRVGTFDRLDAKLARLLQEIRDGLDGKGGLDVSTDDVVVIPAPGG
jgi:cell division protein FtsQ